MSWGGKTMVSERTIAICFALMAGSFFYQAFTGPGGWIGLVEVVTRGFIIIFISGTIYICFFKGSDK